MTLEPIQKTDFKIIFFRTTLYIQSKIFMFLQKEQQKLNL